jgi:hypothetical protein
MSIAQAIAFEQLQQQVGALLAETERLVREQAELAARLAVIEAAEHAIAARRANDALRQRRRQQRRRSREEETQAAPSVFAKSAIRAEAETT